MLKHTRLLRILCFLALLLWFALPAQADWYAERWPGTLGRPGQPLLWTKNPVKGTWEQAKEQCSKLELGDYKDWRLPNEKELKSLFQPAPSWGKGVVSHFPGTDLSWAWASEKTFGEEVILHLGNGVTNLVDRLRTNHAYCVHETKPQRWPKPDTGLFAKIKPQFLLWGPIAETGVDLAENPHFLALNKAMDEMARNPQTAYPPGFAGQFEQVMRLPYNFHNREMSNTWSAALDYSHDPLNWHQAATAVRSQMANPNQPLREGAWYELAVKLLPTRPEQKQFVLEGYIFMAADGYIGELSWYSHAVIPPANCDDACLVKEFKKVIYDILSHPPDWEQESYAGMDFTLVTGVNQLRLRGKNLSGIKANNLDWSNKDLAYSNLTNADLTNTNLSLAKLDGANFKGAILTQTNLQGVSLVGVNLQGQDLSGRDLSNANLTNANLSQAKLDGANLQGATLSQTNLQGVSLVGVDLQSQDLSGRDLSNANLSNANLSNANLSNANLSLAKLDGANLKGAMLTITKLQGVSLVGVDLQGYDFSGLDLSNANLSNTNLTQAKLNGANLKGATLSGTNLQGVSLVGVDLQGYDFSGRDLSNANLTNANLSNSNLTNANLTNTILTNANLNGVDPVAQAAQAAQAPLWGPFQYNGNGTVTDSHTGLVWQQQNDGKERNWNDAKAYCNGLNLAGGGWRLPEKEELEGLLEKEKQGDLKLNQTAFKHLGSGNFYWSATPYAGNSSVAWIVLFRDGRVGRNSQRLERHVRCVRAAGR